MKYTLVSFFTAVCEKQREKTKEDKDVCTVCLDQDELFQTRPCFDFLNLAVVLSLKGAQA